MQEERKVRMVNLGSLNINLDFGNGDGKYGQLTWSIRNGYPRITVFTDSSKESTGAKFDYNTLITAPFDYIEVNKLINAFVALIAAPNDTKVIVQCSNSKFVNGQKTNEIALQASVEMGKDAEGIMYIAVLAEGKKRLKFEIMPKDNGIWHQYFAGENLPYDKARVSREHARSYIEQARRLINHNEAKDLMKETVKDQKPYGMAPTNNVIAAPAADDLVGLV